MRKIFIAALCGLLMNFLTLHAASAAEKIDSVALKNSAVEFCGYILFSERHKEIRRRQEKISDADSKDTQPSAPNEHVQTDDTD